MTSRTGRAGRSEADLIEVLVEARHRGFLGDRPIPAVVEHARHFVAELPPGPGSVLDLGSGGGVPGLVVAFDRPELDVTLLDRRTKRTDFLELAVRRLGWTTGVEVIAGDAAHLAAVSPGRFDAATARGFGPPERTLPVAAALVRSDGLIVVSEPPPDADRTSSLVRWPAELLETAGVERVTSGPHVAVFRRR